MFIYSKRNVLNVYLKEVTLLRKQTINTEYRKLIQGLIMLILYQSTECSFQDSIASVLTHSSIAFQINKPISTRTVNHCQGAQFCLFYLILYVPSTLFQLNRDESSWVEPVLS